nr:NifB/NifX family molybdenum-iron cluster-binding protein [uncultured Carboxylicivirga sp.]
MKIAIPTKDNLVDDHFGHCQYFSIATVDNNEIINIEEVPSPNGCGCKTDIVGTLRNKGVTVMLAGNMGQGAVNKINNANIRVIRGCSGPIEEVIQSYIKGEAIDSKIVCDSHSSHNNKEDHQCSHH